MLVIFNPTFLSRLNVRVFSFRLLLYHFQPCDKTYCHSSILLPFSCVSLISFSFLFNFFSYVTILFIFQCSDDLFQFQMGEAFILLDLNFFYLYAFVLCRRTFVSLFLTFSLSISLLPLDICLCVRVCSNIIHCVDLLR